MNEWKTGAKLADDKPERWPHGWTHRSEAPTVIERWEKGGELKKVKGWGREERRQERETDSMTRDGREGRGKTEGQKKT